MSVRENLIKAKALIDTPEKWAKGPFEFPRMCAIRAIESACGLVYHEGNFCPEGRALQSALDDVLGQNDDWFEHHTVGSLVTVGGYNDARSTSHADVMALFEIAIEDSE